MSEIFSTPSHQQQQQQRTANSEMVSKLLDENSNMVTTIADQSAKGRAHETLEWAFETQSNFLTLNTKD